MQHDGGPGLAKTARRSGRRFAAGGVRRAILGVVAMATVGAAVLALVPSTLPATAAPSRPSTSAPAGPQSVHAPAGLPAGWSVVDAGATLRWQAPAPIRVGGARIEVIADGVPLGVATVAADRRSVSAPLPSGGLGSVRDRSSVQVLAAGRRLDAGPSSIAASARRTADPQAESKARAPQPATAATAVPALPASADPGRPGPYRTRSGEYQLAATAIRGLPVPSEMTALVVAPVGAPGRRPIAFFLHGRHETCYSPEPGADSLRLAWPCPKGWLALPSYRGYRQTQSLLASQGWVTVSISSNAINANDERVADGGAQFRSDLVRAHLTRWAAWTASAAAWSAAPAAVRAGPQPDLSRVFLVGHSRGGEGMNRVAMDTAVAPAAAWRIRGQLLIAPTANGRNPTPGVPTAVLLPYCDGDLFDLPGQSYLDDSRDTAADGALRSAILVQGANHNYFNSEWTPDTSVALSSDDWDDRWDPTCGLGRPTRLTAAEQRAVGATYVAAAARVMVDQDAAVAPLLDGSAVRAASAGRAVVRTHGLGGRRTALFRPDPRQQVQSVGGVRARSCDVTLRGLASRLCLNGPGLTGLTPHFPQAARGVIGAPTRTALDVRWAGAPGATRATGAAQVRLAGPTRLTDAEAVTLRVVVPPRTPATQFAVQLQDADGTTAVIGTATVTGLPGSRTADTTLPGRYWAQEVRLGLDQTQLRQLGLDLANVVGLELLPRSPQGTLWVLDAWGYRPGLSTAPPVPFVRVDVGTVTVQEGQRAGTRQVTLPVTVTGQLAEPAEIWLGNRKADGPPALGLPALVRIPAGARTVQVSVPVTANLLDDADLRRTEVVVRGVRNAVGGRWIGSVSVRDDDPSPAIRITPAATATEGGSLVWSVTLAGPSNRALTIDALAVAVPRPGRELDSSDVPLAWLRTATELTERPVPAEVLSQLPTHVRVTIPRGQTTARLVLPLLRDTRAEGLERVRLRVPAAGPGRRGVPGLPAGAVLTGTVRNRP